MEPTKTQRLILFALGQFYTALNQPLVQKLVQVRTSKIAFIEHLLRAKLISKQERALYKNLETLENKKLILYENRMIMFTEFGLKELEKINKEIQQFVDLEKYFQDEKPKGKLQTMIRS
ncbi:MAG TPA: hypothetical protein VJA18_05860 [Candidatus Nanoarchaeia archaeon]|nr:hypothetical protein [Candidatus Nanoarchaeia archaeon]